jgi:hypothetical protein
LACEGEAPAASIAAAAKAEKKNLDIERTLA